MQEINEICLGIENMRIIVESITTYCAETWRWQKKTQRQTIGLRNGFLETLVQDGPWCHKRYYGSTGTSSERYRG